MTEPNPLTIHPLTALRRDVFPALAAEPDAPRRLALAVVDRLATLRRLPITIEQAVDLLPGNFELDPDDLTLPGRVYATLLTDRHGRGSYYTPPPIADWVVRRVLTHDLPTIIDPAMGAGHFLLAAAEALAGPKTDLMARRRVLGTLHGVDADPNAVKLARLTLWLWLADPTVSSDELPATLICADALLDDLTPSLPDAHFDGVIGNPPYLSVFTRANQQSDDYTQRIRKAYPTATGSFDLAVPFVERAVRWAKPGRRIGLVLPNKLLAADYAADLRAYLTTQVTVEHLADYTTANSFAADVYPVAIIMQRGVPDPAARLDVHWAGDRLDSPPIVRRGSQSDLTSAPGGVWSPALDAHWSALQLSFDDTVRLDSVAHLSGGLTVAEAYDLRDRVIDVPFGALPADAVRLITTGVIRRYRMEWGQKKTRFLKRSYRHPALMRGALPPRRREQADAPKIIVAGLSKQPRALVDLGLSQASVSTTVIISDHWPLGALCAVLNSTLMARLYRALYGGLALSGGYLRVGKRELAALPVPDLPPNDSRLTQLDVLARQMVNADPVTRRSLEAEIDTLVCALYGVDLWAVQSV